MENIKVKAKSLLYMRPYNAEAGKFEKGNEADGLTIYKVVSSVTSFRLSQGQEGVILTILGTALRTEKLNFENFSRQHVLGNSTLSIVMLTSAKSHSPITKSEKILNGRHIKMHGSHSKTWKKMRKQSMI